MNHPRPWWFGFKRSLGQLAFAVPCLCSSNSADGSGPKPPDSSLLEPEPYPCDSAQSLGLARVGTMEVIYLDLIPDKANGEAGKSLPLLSSGELPSFV